MQHPLMPLIYNGAHPSVTSHAFAGVAERHGNPVHVRKDVAESLIARGDFVLSKPEPRRKPVQKEK